MKIKITLLTLAFAVALPARAASPAVPVAATTRPCCEELVSDPAPTARSLYQLDAIWTNDAGRPVRLAAFRDRPVVVAMFFAQCEYACPLLVADLQRLRGLLPDEVRAKTQFVLVSFDSDRDTPVALRAYRERMSLSEGWTLLRGDGHAVQDLAMLLGVKFKQDARGQFAHSNLLTVLNAEGEIVHQLAGLQGDVSPAAKAVALAATVQPRVNVHTHHP